jgi:very-short-patch-repair endonuclease
LEKFDGFKTIDIAIPLAKINIEVDGVHHNANSQQALADLKRTYYSFLEGYYTLRIPNSLLRSNLEETTEYIAEMCNKSYEIQLKGR